MDEKLFINKSTLTGIANSIRSKTGTTDPIRTDSMASAIMSISIPSVPESEATINGFKYACGTFSFESDVIQDIYIDHDDVGETKLILVWCEKPTTESVAYKVLSFYIPTDGSNRWKNSGAIYFSTSGDMTYGNPANANAHAIYYKNNTRFVIGAGTPNGARILAGKTYHWLVIGGG